jgi:choline dehydrogenase-like flavoprotein
MLEINAETVVLSAGGLGTPVILQNSGIKAGQALYMDMFVIVYGRSSKFRPAGEPSMSTIFEEDKGRPYILAPHVDAALMFQGIKGWFGAKPPYGIMVKTRDKNSGRVDKNGRVFKRLEETDMHSLTEGEELARRIMASAGVSKDDITVSEPTGGHPGGTAAIGTVIKPNLECRAVKSLYVCDASVFPESPGKPPIISICALGKWLGRRLAEK